MTTGTDCTSPVFNNSNKTSITYYLHLIENIIVPVPLQQMLIVQIYKYKNSLSGLTKLTDTR